MTNTDRTVRSRRGRLAATRPALSSRLDALVELSGRGLSQMHRNTGTDFVQTLRGVRTEHGSVLRSEGDNLRYAAIVALGLARRPVEEQMQVLSGRSVTELMASVVERAATHPDPGAIALAAWASAELSGVFEAQLFLRWAELLASQAPIPTVDTSWAITAALAARKLGDTSAVLGPAMTRLQAAQGPQGIFPHMLPAASQGRWRAHVGCFADQVYPIQALSRVHAAPATLPSWPRPTVAPTDLRPPRHAGPWWWHYDARDGSVVERFPVYSVHQHAMAPMALFELREAGGDDHIDEIMLGLGWMERHPEVVEELVSPVKGVIWRKVGRREPLKAARSLAAVTTALHPGLHVSGLDRILPANKVDYECRPYELGWLLYAWLADGVARSGRRSVGSP